MMSEKTLYISDLDGTLLNEHAELSDFTADALRKLCAAGVQLSIATARTAATVAKMFDGIPLPVPAVLMNGVCIYSPANGEYVKAAYIGDDAKHKAVDIIRKNGLSGFWYSVENGRLSTFYENTDSPNAVSFIEERQRKYNKIFTKVDSFSSLCGKGLLYYSVADTEAALKNAALEFSSVQGLRTEYYRDIYDTDCMYLELCACEASKNTAVDFLRAEYGFDRIVGFGDNYNDLPLLEACDEFYAAGNAVDEVKRRATGVIGPNTQDSVARWLLENAV